MGPVTKHSGDCEEDGSHRHRDTNLFLLGSSSLLCGLGKFLFFHTCSFIVPGMPQIIGYSAPSIWFSLKRSLCLIGGTKCLGKRCASEIARPSGLGWVGRNSFTWLLARPTFRLPPADGAVVQGPDSSERALQISPPPA